jgi:hypothetical protein
MSTIAYDMKGGAKVPMPQVLILGAGLLMSALTAAPAGLIRVLAGFHLVGGELAGSIPAAATYWGLQAAVALYAIGTERLFRRCLALGLILAAGVAGVVG